mmetsp:Transcript_35552/g.65802  ORF Transcript_35552/g.65802 Transcript_35552/m.65802 type:complete len:428 (+) Transcript_35552:405-1688(+)
MERRLRRRFSARAGIIRGGAKIAAAVPAERVHHAHLLHRMLLSIFHALEAQSRLEHFRRGHSHGVDSGRRRRRSAHRYSRGVEDDVGVQDVADDAAADDDAPSRVELRLHGGEEGGCGTGIHGMDETAFVVVVAAAVTLELRIHRTAMLAALRVQTRECIHRRDAPAHRVIRTHHSAQTERTTAAASFARQSLESRRVQEASGSDSSHSQSLGGGGGCEVIGVELMYDRLLVMLGLLLDDGTHFETALFVPADEIYVVEYHDARYGLFDLAESPSVQLANETHEFTLGIKVLGQHLLLEYLLIPYDELIVIVLVVVVVGQPFQDAFSRCRHRAVPRFVFDDFHELLGKGRFFRFFLFFFGGRRRCDCDGRCRRHRRRCCFGTGRRRDDVRRGFRRWVRWDGCGWRCVEAREVGIYFGWHGLCVCVCI